MSINARSYLLKFFRNTHSLPLLEDGNIINFAKDIWGPIYIVDYGDYRILNFESLFEQSCMRIGKPYQLVHQYTQFMVLALAFIQPAHVSFFGLGGGSLLRTLHHVLPDCLFRVVELRQKVVDIAHEYFFIPNDHRVSITVNDAVQEIANIEDNSSDILFSDMYDAYKMIPAQIQKIFLLNCSRVLTDRGWLVINLHHLPSDSEAFFEMLRKLFPTVILSLSGENTILLVSKAPPEHVRCNIQHIEAVERAVGQPLSQLMRRLTPLNSGSHN